MNLSNIFNKSNIYGFFRTAKETNLSTLLYRTRETLWDAIRYPIWYRQSLPTKQELENQRQTDFSYEPCISIVVPTYRTPLPFLKEMIDSLKNQTYSNWELCIADASGTDAEIRPVLFTYEKEDDRIKVQFLDENYGISGNTNRALTMATGEYIGLLDHDDLLAPNALYEVVEALNKDRAIDILYTDEDKVDLSGKNHYYPSFKPDYNPYLLRSCNYICHFFVFKSEIYREIGEFSTEYDGSQDYNYILRATAQAKKIHHIDKMLYHWRVHGGSVASDPNQKSYCYDSARRALQENLTHKGIPGTVGYSRLMGYYDTNYESLSAASTKILTAKDFSDRRKLHSLLSKSPDFYCCYLGEGVPDLKEEQWKQLLSYFQNKEMGIVTPKLLYNQKILCLGTSYNGKKQIGCYVGVPDTDVGFYGRAILDQSVPFASPLAFVCKSKDLLAFLENTNFKKEQIHSITDFILAFSLYISGNGLQIVASAQVHQSCERKNLPQPNKAFVEAHKKQLTRQAKMYKVQPYKHS